MISEGIRELRRGACLIAAFRARSIQFNFREIFGTSPMAIDRRTTRHAYGMALVCFLLKLRKEHTVVDSDLPSVFRPNRLLELEDGGC